MFSQQLNTPRKCKRLVKALIRLRVCAGWSEILLIGVVTHTTLEISCCGSFCTVHSLYNTMFEVLRNGLLVNFVIKVQFYKGVVKFHGKKIGRHNMTVLNPHPCCNKEMYCM